MRRMSGLFALLVCTSFISAQAPWLSSKEQEHLKSLWPKGIELPTNIKFYDLPQVYQSRFILNDTPTLRIEPANTPVDGKVNTNLLHPWAVSGGMQFADKKDWRSAKAIALPETNPYIYYWYERSTAPLAGRTLIPSVEWRFPKGTRFFDMLIRVKNGKDSHVFELREQEKRDGDWDDGTMYRPFASLTSAPDGSDLTRDGWWNERFVEHKMPKASFRYYLTSSLLNLENPTFSPSRLLVTDENEFAPKGYYGTGMACNTCHKRAGRGTSYGAEVRGRDGRFSWHPFSADNQYVNTSWPLKRLADRIGDTSLSPIGQPGSR
jgi:hypothetical protein